MDTKSKTHIYSETRQIIQANSKATRQFTAPILNRELREFPRIIFALPFHFLTANFENFR